MIDLRVVVLTLNEEENIGSCLDSVFNLGFSATIVDSGSSDATAVLAEARGADILVNVPQGGFRISEQRNWAVAQLRERCEWIVFLDADERATREFMDSAITSIKSDNAMAYYAAPKFVYQGNWLRRYMGYPNWHPRVANSRLDAPFCGGVWEEFRSDLKAGRIEEPYIHYPNSKGYYDWFFRHLRYISWDIEQEVQAQKVARRPRLRKIARLAGPLEPLFVELFHLVARGGLLDGGSVMSYSRRHLVYRLMMTEARREVKRELRGLPR